MRDLINEKMTSFQLTTLIIMFLMGTAGLTSSGVQAGKDAWLAIIAGFVGALFLVWIYTSLAAMFPAHTIVQINEHVFGKYLGSAVSLFYIFYYFTMSSWVLRNLGDFFNILLSFTPITVFLVLFLITCAYAAIKGIAVISNVGLILLSLLVAEIGIAFIMVSPRVQLEQLLPVMLGTPLKDFMKGAHQVLSYPFGEAVVFLMIINLLNDQEKVRPVMVKGFAIAAIILIVLAIRNVAVLGPTLDEHLFSSLAVVRLINLGEIINRVEIVILFVLLSSGFIYMSVTYYAISVGFAQIFRLKSYLPMILPVGLLYYIYAIVIFDNISHSIRYAVNTYPYFAMIPQLVVPLLTLAIAGFRNRLQAVNTEGEL